ncbi:unnamed protein product [Cyprideis torosa]|uniref:Uncharacterized protein n=1 Tax=Cyprideis torosa TaxID=163714 RepID=A0A7R8WIN2_9CRUS|nr:unnamed protein product [Cyprideis torosa]CAG0899022.1 unnamed protein product [Cyprideis torosa]
MSDDWNLILGITRDATNSSWVKMSDQVEVKYDLTQLSQITDPASCTIAVRLANPPEFLCEMSFSGKHFPLCERPPKVTVGYGKACDGDDKKCQFGSCISGICQCPEGRVLAYDKGSCVTCSKRSVEINRCYFIVENVASKAEAEASCQTFGATLADISSSEDETAIRSVINQNWQSDWFMWMGLEESSGTWLKTFGQSPATYFNWKVCDENPAPSLCLNDFTFDHAEGPPYPLWTMAEVHCGDESFSGTCTGEPYGWFFLRNPTKACAPCLTCGPPPPIPCAKLLTTPAAKSPVGTNISYSCPAALKNESIEISCRENGTWSDATCSETVKHEEYEGQCFVLHHEPANFVDAMTVCRKTYSGTLGQLESLKMMEAMSQYLGNSNASLFVRNTIRANNPSILAQLESDTVISADILAQIFKFSNGSQIPGDLFLNRSSAHGSEPLGECLTYLAHEVKLRDTSCNAGHGFICQIHTAGGGFLQRHIYRASS